MSTPNGRIRPLSRERLGLATLVIGGVVTVVAWIVVVAWLLWQLF